MLFTVTFFFFAILMFFIGVDSVGGGGVGETFPFFSNNVLSATNIPTSGVFVAESCNLELKESR